jgi:hypothetical protein
MVIIIQQIHKKKSISYKILQIVHINNNIAMTEII